jgi:hypothetical protein
MELNTDEEFELNLDDLGNVAGGNYEGPIPYSDIDEKAKLLDWIRDTYGLENACCAAGGFYWDDAATEIFRTQGGFMWGQYIKSHYNPRQGLDG